MKKITVRRRPVTIESLRLREALERDSHIFINEPTLVYEGNKLKIVYAYLPNGQQKLINALRSVTYQRDWRSAGLPTESRVFGYNPRSTLRKDFCASASMAAQFPLQHAAICEGARLAEALYELYAPDLYHYHKRVANEKVLKDWRIGDVFTSGIANKDNQLKYHFDTGNFADVWSGMFVFKRKIQGGYLSVPEYDLCFQLRDHSILLFDGQGLLHGVTPFKKLGPGAYRYTVVYYSMRQMWNCLTPSNELLRIRKLKTQREHRRAGL